MKPLPSAGSPPPDQGGDAGGGPAGDGDRILLDETSAGHGVQCGDGLRQGDGVVLGDERNADGDPQRGAGGDERERDVGIGELGIGVRQGTVGVPGNGVSRETGMCVCSPMTMQSKSGPAAWALIPRRQPGRLK